MTNMNYVRKNKSEVKMICKYKHLILTISLFLVGNLLCYKGFTKGEEIAINLSRPIDSSSWDTSSGMIIGCTYTPVIMGIALIVISIIFSTILFYEWVSTK
jgi:hypothetical protein